MAGRSIIPPGMQGAYDEMKMSPGLLSGDHLFLTGMTGGDVQGRMPEDPAAQMRNAFDKIGLILKDAGLGYGAIVEMTTYHIGLRAHFDLFAAIRQDYVEEPYPAWTAVEVAGLRREGAIIEIRAIASTLRGA
jgi:enamine deaminase RidA (YjgF/YER057c/UK114 family)